MHADRSRWGHTRVRAGTHASSWHNHVALHVPVLGLKNRRSRQRRPFAAAPRVRKAARYLESASGTQLQTPTKSTIAWKALS